MPGANDARWAGCGELLRVRVRLAHLTGHICFDEIEDSEYQKWEDEYVKVRVKAVELSAALCRAVSTLFSSTRQKDIMLRIQAASLNEGQETSPERLVNILLKPPPTYSQAGWRMDSAQLEAILGLWMWTIVFGNRVKKDDNRDLQTVSLIAQNLGMIFI